MASKPHVEPIVNNTGQTARAAMLAIGTANPANSIPQDKYADWYFRVTKSEHLANLKEKMKKICLNSGIKKRYLLHTEDTIRDHPELAVHDQPSLDVRQDILAAAMPELVAEAAARAIAEWGRPTSDINHVVFTSYSSLLIPGADLRLVTLLGLRRSVQRTAMNYLGCSSAAASLCVAKDIAENNHGARVLVAGAEFSLMLFRAPQEDHIENWF